MTPAGQAQLSKWFRPLSVADHLVGTSTLARVLLRQTTAEWKQRTAAELVALCDLTELETLHPTRPEKDRTAVRGRLHQFARCPMPDGIYQRIRVVDFETNARTTGQPVRMIDLKG